MDFTREPVIETVITPKEGCKLVIRNSKGTGQEEYFVDAVEVITFSQAIFFRSLERPKPFIVPASDYEVLEVREARIVLKNVGLDRSIKIGGGRDASIRSTGKEEEKAEVELQAQAQDAKQEGRPEGRNERRRDRRRQSKRRREAVDGTTETEEFKTEEKEAAGDERIELVPPVLIGAEENGITPGNGALLASLLAPPPLVSETIKHYQEKYKDAFYTKEEQEARLSFDPDHIPLASEPVLEPEGQVHAPISLEQPAFGAFELSEEAEEEIYRQRKRKFLAEDSVKVDEPFEPIHPIAEPISEEKPE